MTYSERLELIAARIREPESLDPPIPGELDIPYFGKSEIESHLFVTSQGLLLDIPQEELESIGSDAVISISGGGSLGGLWGLNMPIGVISVLSVTIDGEPCSETSFEGFLQLAQAPDADAAIYTFAMGRCYFKGTVITIIALREPTLAQFQSDSNIFPPSYDLEMVDQTVDRLQIIDFLQPMNLYGGVSNELV